MRKSKRKLAFARETIGVLGRLQLTTVAAGDAETKRLTFELRVCAELNVETPPRSK